MDLAGVFILKVEDRVDVVNGLLILFIDEKVPDTQKMVLDIVVDLPYIVDMFNVGTHILQAVFVGDVLQIISFSLIRGHDVPVGIDDEEQHEQLQEDDEQKIDIGNVMESDHTVIETVTNEGI